MFRPAAVADDKQFIAGDGRSPDERGQRRKPQLRLGRLQPPVRRQAQVPVQRDALRDLRLAGPQKGSLRHLPCVRVLLRPWEGRHGSMNN